MTQLGKELRELRIERDLTLDVVAKITGINKQALAMLEKGEKKSAELLFKIAKVYEVPVDYFFKYAYKDELVKS
jgi:XRE family transcriptional regulator, regulator of sulfur utilization